MSQGTQGFSGRKTSPSGQSGLSSSHIGPRGSLFTRKQSPEPDTSDSDKVVHPGTPVVWGPRPRNAPGTPPIPPASGTSSPNGGSHGGQQARHKHILRKLSKDTLGALQRVLTGSSSPSPSPSRAPSRRPRAAFLNQLVSSVPAPGLRRSSSASPAGTAPSSVPPQAETPAQRRRT